MPDDMSLDAFASTESDEERADDEADGSSVPSTYDWNPDGAACVECGETVARRWRDGDGLVCDDCKEW